jgi:small basic protein
MEPHMRRNVLKFKISIGILIAFLSLVAITTSLLLYRSVQEEARLNAVIAGYETKLTNVNERNMRIVSYTNHLLMTLEQQKQQEGN